MSKLAFINNHSQGQEHTINTLISFKDFTEYYQYKHRPMYDIVDLMNSRRNEQLERQIIDKNVREVLENTTTTKMIQDLLKKAIEESLGK